ncbi:M23 family metallopeptidase [Flavobacterium hiemivividum]|uniref:M23 family metallopeptidase n=1 Tax=Flavobacterium hiemivividum TaxID=2541734 RepID=A0A4R5CX65_9FLAO|nr:M23 family metallopeptidase [Flavobacterium hiemivividum]TDE03164.1 M23 family metallopeptidase [Flavobacterium hiemivividum]
MRFVICFLLFSASVLAQTTFPKDYFSPPLDIPMQLSGNFGELRSNHFHAGLDYRTLQREGLNVRAAGDGYVSRIKISPFGNGKAIYITHPNGYTSVYCHLQRATDAIESFIFKTHYKEKSYEIEMFLKPGELVVKKGQIIALSGNTGSSGGPHLHFEFRDSKTEKVINPFLFGFDKDFKDTKKPTVSAVYVYPVDSKSSVNRSKRPLLLNLSLQKDGSYLANKVVANGKIGFGVSAVDYNNMSANRTGIYKLQTFLNGKPNFGFQMDTFSFDEMRYINALVDYARFKTTSQKVQKLFMVNPYKLSLIKTDDTNGVITVVPNLTSVYRIEVSDFTGNTTTISIPISYDPSAPIVEKEAVVSNYFIKVNKDNSFAKNNMSVFFPAGTFYEDFDMNFDAKGDALYLHDGTIAVHSNFTITIEDGKYTDSQKEKVFIADIDKSGKLGYNTTYNKDNVFTAKVRSLGTYKLAMDTTAPTISIGNSIEGKWIISQKTIQLSINDSGSGIKSYNGYLNGNWILFEYDNKTRKITHDFKDGVVAEGANDLKVVVTDNVGNSTIFETSFFRSQK